MLERYSAVRSATDEASLAFRLGQIDALTRFLEASPAIFSPEIRRFFALRSLVRAWAHYREDRAIALGEHLVGAECAAERDAFLMLLEHALPPREKQLRIAAAMVRKMAILPLASERAESASIIAPVALVPMM